MLLAKTLMKIKQVDIMLPCFVIATPLWVILAVYSHINGVENTLLMNLYLIVILIGASFRYAPTYDQYRDMLVDSSTKISTIMDLMIDDHSTGKIIKILLCIEILEYSAYYYIICRLFLNERNKNSFELLKKFQ